MSESKSILSGAEYRVVRFVSLGKSNKQIASSSGVGVSMVKYLVGRILAKLGLKNRVEVEIYGLMIAGFRHESVLQRRLELWRNRPMTSKHRR